MKTLKEEKLIKGEVKEGGERLDIYLTRYKEIYSRSLAEKLIKAKLVWVDGKHRPKNYRVKKGEIIKVVIPSPQEPQVIPQNITFKVLFEDSDILVVSKPAGMVTHPSYGHYQDTLVNALLFHTKNLSQVGGPKRPGIVHRLDKDTSGLLIIAKNDYAHLRLVEDLRERKVKRTYLALVCGNISPDYGTIRAPLGRDFRNRKKIKVTPRGREAITHFKVLERFDKYVLLEINLETGRTHQIRTHLSFIGHPVVGDFIYGGRKEGKELGMKRQFLHAYRLEFLHPRTGKKLFFQDELPCDLKKVLKYLREGERD